MERAIREGKLTPYYYYPVVVYLEDDELERYKDLSYQISMNSMLQKSGELKVTERGKMLLLARSRIIAGAKQKIDALKKTIKPYKNDTIC